MKYKINNKVKLLLFILIIILIIGGLYLILAKAKKVENSYSEIEIDGKSELKLNTLDLNSDSRNIAVMYNNISDVWGVQSGLQEAYIVYEMIVEGGYTRLMAIFKDKKMNRIGCIRSSRPYFLDYVLENDAIYIHFGASKQALSDIETLKIENINYMNYSTGYWRDKTVNLSLEHTAFTSTDLINKAIDKYEYRTTTKEKTLLNYQIDEVDLSIREDSIKADTVFIDYSAVRNTSYIYDKENKVYLRRQGTARNTYEHIDGVTEKQYTAKNIITYKVTNKTLDKKGRQSLDNIGSGEGYFITDGYAVPITWKKENRNSKTIYKYADGKEIVVNDGNTFIQIQPSDEELVIE